MKIVCLQAENVKRLKAVTIRPDGNLVMITGRNGQGKTSVLDAIYWALAGANHVQQMPIRKGAGRARIRLNLGDILVQRTFSRRVKDDATTTSLIVETAEGARYPSPQAMLDELLGELSFDPLAFSRAPVKEQVDMLKRLVPGVDFDAIAEQNKRDYDERTEVNRAAKRAKGAAESLGVAKVPKGFKAEPVDENEIVLELEAAGKHNAIIATQQANREAAEEKIAYWNDESSRLLTEAAKMQARANDLQRQANELEAELEAAGDLPATVDTSSIRKRLDAARQRNDEIERIVAYRKHVDELTQYETRSRELTEAIEQRNAAKRAAIAGADLPIDGLDFDEDRVEMRGVPFEQASDAEQLRASCAIAAALNPKLRVIRIRDGSLLDEDGLALLAQFADANEMQVWLEKVDSTGKVGFVIEDGELAHSETPTNEETKP